MTQGPVEYREQQSPDALQPQRIATALASGIAALDGPTADSVLGTASICSLDPFPNLYVAKGTGHEVWQVTLELVKSLSEVILTTVPNFWKIAKSYTDGKYKKVRI